MNKTKNKEKQNSDLYSIDIKKIKKEIIRNRNNSNKRHSTINKSKDTHRKVYNSLFKSTSMNNNNSYLDLYKKRNLSQSDMLKSNTISKNNSKKKKLSLKHTTSNYSAKEDMLNRQSSFKPTIKTKLSNAEIELFFQYPYSSTSNTLNSMTPLNKISYSPQTYSNLNKWSNLFLSRNINTNMNTIPPSSDNKVKKHKKNIPSFLSNRNNDKIYYKKEIKYDISNFLISKKNQMINQIISKKKVNYNLPVKLKEFKVYSDLNFKEKFNYLINIGLNK